MIRKGHKGHKVHMAGKEHTVGKACSHNKRLRPLGKGHTDIG